MNICIRATLEEAHAGLVGLAAGADAAGDGHEPQIKDLQNNQGPERYKSRA